MSSALTYIAIANFFGTQPPPNASVIAAGSIPGPLPAPFQFRTNRYDFTYTPDIGVHKVPNGLATWNTARRNCQDQGGHLAIVNSVAEAEAIGRVLNASNINYGWVGVHDLYQEDDFVTIHGESLAQTGFDVWRANEPNNVGGNENCVVFSSGGELADVSCMSRFNSICEFPVRYVQSDPLATPIRPESTQATEIVNPGIA